MTRPVPSPVRPPFARIARAGTSAAALALVGTLTLFGAARLAGLLTVAPDAGGATPGAPGLLAIVGMAIAAPTIATLLFLALTRFLPRPGAVFVGIATMVFAGFFVGPLTLGASVPLTAILEVMHLVVAAPIVAGLLATLPSRERRRDRTATPSVPDRRPA